jgi:glycosyltransferase involved in cell wall biosynthesis
VKGIMEGSKNENMFLYVLRRSINETAIQHRNIYITDSRNKYKVKSLLELVRVIRDNDIRILHCHLTKSFCFGFLLKKIFFKDIVLIFHEHGNIFVNGYCYNLFLKTIRSTIDLFIAVSNAVKVKLAEGAGIDEKKIKVLYNFVDLNKFHVDKKQEKEKLKFDDKNYFVGFAGRLVKRKGWEEFIKAAYLLRDKYPRTGFFVAGDGPDKSRVLKLIEELSIKDSVKYLGFVPDMNYFYNLMDCLVIPSHWEPLGLVGIEANACGVPVIAANVDGLRELINDRENGLLFQPKNEHDLAEKIQIIIEDRDLRHKLISNGLCKVKSFSQSEYIRTLMEIYKGL